MSVYEVFAYEKMIEEDLKSYQEIKIMKILDQHSPNSPLKETKIYDNLICV
jgi:hypothetical protein